jgi:ribosome-associated translation inhibitor RaiA
VDIIIQSLGFRAGEALESLIKEKLGNLKSDNIVRANVTLYKGPAGNPDADYCEIRLEVPGNDHFVKRQHENFEMAVTECVDILALQIKKSKDKYLDSRQGDAEVIQDVIMEPGDDDVELEDVVK